MNMLLSLPQHLKFSDCTVKCDKKFMVDSHHSSAKHQRGLLHEKASTHPFLKTPIPDFTEKLTRCFFVLT